MLLRLCLHSKRNLIPIALALSAGLAAHRAQAAPLPDPEAVFAAAQEVTPENYPNADDVVVENVVNVTYEADGTSVTIDDEYTKVLTEKGKRQHQNLSFHYTLPYGTVTVTTLEIIKPDGTIVPIDVEQQSRVMVNRSQMSANIYNPNSKILRAGVPGIEIGDICHVTTRDELVKPRVPDTWSDYSVFEYTMPMRHLLYEINAPKSLPLTNIALKDTVADTVTRRQQEDGDRIIYRWEVSDVPRTFSEPNMPAMYTVVQRLLVSTIPDWPYISRWYWNLCLPHLNAVNDAMRTKVDELTVDAESRYDKINALFQFVSQEIRYMGITTETEAPGYEPHDVSTTFDNRYGVCRDKAALLVAMFRLADMPACPVIIQVGPKKDEEVPQPYFNHAIVAVGNGENGYILMDPTDENTSELLPAYLCNRSYLVAHPEGEELLTSPIIPAESNMLHIATTGSLDDNGTLTASTTVRFEGINDNLYRRYFSRLKPTERKRFFEGMLKRRIAGATLEDYRISPVDIQDTSEQLTVGLTFEAARFPVTGDTHTVLNLPWLGTSLGYVNFVLGRTGLTEREYPLKTDVACGVTETFVIVTGDAMDDPISIPSVSPVDNRGVLFTGNVAMADNALRGSSTFKVNKVEFSPEEYLVLKQNLKDIEYERRKASLFAGETGEGEHDVRVLLHEKTVTLHRPTRWDETYRVTKEVLTYAGKKQNAELKIGFNPVWETVILTNALVTTADGDTRRVVAEEINVMDAGWVGAAPRYAPGKTKVISLPGVEIGSTITYEIIRRKCGRPFFSTFTSFASHDPVLTNRLTITVPAGLPSQTRDDTGEPVTYQRHTGEGVVTHTWEAVNQPLIPKEDALPPRWSFTPSVFFSCGDWADYARTVSAAFQDKTNATEAVRDATREAVAGHKGKRSQVRAIRDYVARNVRSVGPGIDDLPLTEITPAEQTLTDGYGNSADRAALFAAMLGATGLQPELVLASAGMPELPSLHAPLLEIPQRNVFGHVLVRVSLDGETVYLGDTDQYAALGATHYHQHPGLTLAGDPVTIRATTACEPYQRTVYDVHVDADGTAVITHKKTLYGTAYGSFHRRFAELPPEERRRYYLELLGSLSQAAEAETDLVTSYKSYPGERIHTARVARYAVRSGDYLTVTLPGALPTPAALRAATRTQPLYRAGRLDAETVYRVFLPESTDTIAIAPDDLQWQAPSGLGSIAIDTETVDQPADGDPHITITQRIALAPAVIPAYEYPALQEMNRRLQHRKQQTVLVRLKDGQ